MLNLNSLFILFFIKIQCHGTHLSIELLSGESFAQGQPNNPFCQVPWLTLIHLEDLCQIPTTKDRADNCRYLAEALAFLYLQISMPY